MKIKKLILIIAFGLFLLVGFQGIDFVFNKTQAPWAKISPTSVASTHTKNFALTCTLDGLAIQCSLRNISADSITLQSFHIGYFGSLVVERYDYSTGLWYIAPLKPDVLTFAKGSAVEFYFGPTIAPGDIVPPSRPRNPPRSVTFEILPENHEIPWIVPTLIRITQTFDSRLSVPNFWYGRVTSNEILYIGGLFPMIISSFFLIMALLFYRSKFSEKCKQN